MSTTFESNRTASLLPALRLGLALGVVSSLLPVGAAGQEVFELKWKESGIRETVTGFRPHALAMSNGVPASLKKAPTGLNQPAYGAFEIGPDKAPATILVIYDQAAEGLPRLFVDSNANGDLTDDPPATSEMKPYKTPDGREGKNWQGQGTVVIPFATGPRNGKVNFYTTDRPVPNKSLSKILYYYADYALVGEVKIAGKTYGAALMDGACSGDFRLSSDVLQSPTFWLDAPSGTQAKGRMVAATRPFEVDGKWWAITNLTPEGKFQIAASTKPPEPKKVEGPDLGAGKKAPAFTGKLLSGKTVNFPGDYKGKVVLLDFWATWCGPCIAELPHLVKAYEANHDKGLEVLGISLDREQWEEKLAKFTAQRKMPWPQVYDGKYWGAEVAKLYGITSIPRMLLVDGGTGVILAGGNDIRGQALGPAIEKALAGKKK